MNEKTVPYVLIRVIAAGVETVSLCAETTRQETQALSIYTKIRPIIQLIDEELKSERGLK